MLRRPDEIDFAAIVRPGDTVLCGQALSEPLTLTRRLVAQAGAIGPFRVVLGVTLSDTFALERSGGITFLSFGAIGAAALAKAGRLDVQPMPYGRFNAAFATGAFKADVVLLQVAPPPPGQDRYSLSLGNDYAVLAARHARVVVAEVNPDAPWTHGALLPDDVRPDLLVAAAAPPQEFLVPKLGDVERRIAAHIATCIPDGACLQFGVGTIPAAALAGLAGHRDLAIHSGVILDDCVALVEAGVITNARKPFDVGVSVGNIMIGSGRLFRWLHDNPAVVVREIAYTHGLGVLAQLRDFRAINSAVEVDLTGQINAEMAGGAYLGGIGGQLEFARGALAGSGGRSIVALPATARGGSVSRIVVRPEIVTIPRADADLVVTEYGVADLRGATLGQRAARMIAVAHPDFREDLARSWRDGGLGAM